MHRALPYVQHDIDAANRYNQNTSRRGPIMALLRLATLVFIFIGAAGSAGAEVIRLYSTNAIQQPMRALIPAFERSSGHQVQAIFEPTAAVMERLKSGGNPDLIFLLKGSLQSLKQSGVVRGDTEKELASVSMGVAVREGVPRPDISSVDRFEAFLKSAPTIAVSRVGASGVEFAKAVDRAGLGEIKGRFLMVDGATPTAEAVARGEAVLAVQMLSELKAVKGVIALGPLPGSYHFQITVSSAVATQATPAASAAAEDLVRFMARPESQEQLRQAGMVPL